jgi:hypothetical protein
VGLWRPSEDAHDLTTFKASHAKALASQLHERARTVRNIKAQFSVSNAPERVVIDNPEDLELQGIKSDFQGKAWDLIPDEMLLRRAEALFFFTPAAWEYYIPAYMTFMVRDLRGSDFISDTFIGSFMHKGDAVRSFLSGRQRGVVADVLEWVMEQRKENWPQGLGTVRTGLSQMRRVLGQVSMLSA